MLGALRQLLLVTALVFCTSASADGEKMLRSPKTQCGIYLTRVPDRANGIEDTKGKLLVASTNPAEFEKFLDAQGEALELPADAKLAIVGAPWDRKSRAKTEEDLRTALEQRGFRDVPLQSIRQISSWSERVQGVFQLVDGEWVRKSGAAPGEVKTGLDRGAIEDGVPTMIVGAPVLGRNAERYDDFLSKAFEHAEFEQTSDGFATPVSRQSVPGAMVRRALAHPIEFMGYLGRRAQSWLPFKEDYQQPTRSESASAIQKLVIPGGLTLGVMTVQSLLGGKPFSMVLPTTFFNGLNSYIHGEWKATFQNWFRRSMSLFPDQFAKDLTLSLIFTTDIYFGGDPSRWSSVFELGAWQTYLSTKWLSILFNASWRAPNNRVVSSWERYATEKLGRDPVSSRHAGAVISKYTSYIMTQFFIYSIISADALFKVAMTPQGLGIFPDAPLPEGATQLMAFNVGHAAMAACGVASACISFARGPQTWIADLAVKVDAYEGRFLRWVLRRGGEEK